MHKISSSGIGAVVMSWIATSLTANAADCTIAESSKALDPVEVGFCEADAVFVGVVESSVDTESGVQTDSATRTQHQKVRRSTVRVNERLKGKPSDKVTMMAEVYSKRGYVFESGKSYLIFAQKVSGNEYEGANSTCSVQSTLPIESAVLQLDQLRLHKRGVKKIDCKKIRPKETV